MTLPTLSTRRPAFLFLLLVPLGCAPELECELGAYCNDDEDCIGEFDCNYALDPPRCQTLFCGNAGAPCHSSDFCASQLCSSEICLAETTRCGEDVVPQNRSQAPVSPLHCGACDRSCDDALPVGFSEPECVELISGWRCDGWGTFDDRELSCSELCAYSGGDCSSANWDDEEGHHSRCGDSPGSAQRVVCQCRFAL